MQTDADYAQTYADYEYVKNKALWRAGLDSYLTYVKICLIMGI